MGDGQDGAKDDAIGAVRRLLNSQLKVKVKDGRILVGRFTCLDRQGNIILAETTQYTEQHPGQATAEVPRRHLGLTLVPRQQRVSCKAEVERELLDKLAASTPAAKRLSIDGA